MNPPSVRILDERKAEPDGVGSSFSEVLYTFVTPDQLKRSSYPSDSLSGVWIKRVGQSGDAYKFRVISGLVVPRLVVMVESEMCPRDLELEDLALKIRNERVGGYIGVNGKSLRSSCYWGGNYSVEIYLTDEELTFNDGEEHEIGNGVNLLTPEGFMAVDRLLGNTKNPCQYDRNHATNKSEWDRIFGRYNYENGGRIIVNGLARTFGKRIPNLPQAMKVDQKAAVDFIDHLQRVHGFELEVERVSFGSVSLTQLNASALPRENIISIKDENGEEVDPRTLRIDNSAAMQRYLEYCRKEFSKVPF